MRPRLLHGLRLLLIMLLTAALGACSVQQPKLPDQDIGAAARPADRPTTIALLGGTGFAGGYILREALARGYSVRVLSRSPDKLAYLGARISVIEGDARDPRALAKLLQSADAVISAIGPPRAGGDSRSGLNSAVTQAMIPAMRAAGLSRYIVISGAGVVLPGDQRDFLGWWMRQLVRLRYPGILEDRQSEYALLARSDLDWTLLRCPLLEAGEARAAPEVSLRTPGGFYLRAGELANFALDQLDERRYSRTGPFLNSPRH